MTDDVITMSNYNAIHFTKTMMKVNNKAMSNNDDTLNDYDKDTLNYNEDKTLNDNDNGTSKDYDDNNVIFKAAANDDTNAMNKDVTTKAAIANNNANNDVTTNAVKTKVADDEDSRNHSQTNYDDAANEYLLNLPSQDPPDADDDLHIITYAANTNNDNDIPVLQN
eukprot:CAMPEP_0172511836 /NCGR_PEP_ID=MMETSP1066-20121228/239629_1 /TAXON_ID=671091 /ORGANISM="Coscinodiscus wailesii, Strain CCMP2513" /LENGTH=165 /DNA_ID=CAMNT_0013291389 /DNA_START=36 /DNA_END=530 /DNA_ORIENTATION=+